MKESVSGRREGRPILNSILKTWGIQTSVRALLNMEMNLPVLVLVQAFKDAHR